MRRIIAFIGPAGCGKSTAAAALDGATRHRFAGPLKRMLHALGLTWEEIDGAHKEDPCALLGYKTPREAMQSLGTEWGRDTIDPDLWMRAWLVSLPAEGLIVVDDCRFPNEADAIRAAGGIIVRVHRPGHTNPAPAHESEQHSAAMKADYEISASTVADLQHMVRDMFGEPDRTETPDDGLQPIKFDGLGGGA